MLAPQVPSGVFPTIPAAVSTPVRHSRKRRPLLVTPTAPPRRRVCLVSFPLPVAHCSLAPPISGAVPARLDWLDPESMFPRRWISRGWPGSGIDLPWSAVHAGTHPLLSDLATWQSKSALVKLILNLEFK